MRVLLASFLASCGLAGCGSSAMRAASDGDYPRLRSEITPEHERGKISKGEAADLARAVATHELVSAKDEASATARVRESEPCAMDVDDALEARMKQHDGAGAEAALLRLEAGNLSEGSARDLLTDTDDRWRAVGVRTLHRSKDGKDRRAALFDPSPRVRRSAIRASAKAGDAADLDVLLETARVDPELMLRNEAIRAMSAIVREDKSRAGELAMRLRDLWNAGDDAVREDVAVAWALSPVFDNGGREALRVQLASGRGPGAIAAAAVILRTTPKDAELTSSASALLARTIAEGSGRDRLHAIVSARLDGAELEALRKAAKEEDADVRVAALGRLLASKPDHDAATRDLETVAGYGVKGTPSDDPRARDLAARARLALAYAGDVRIQAWIEEDLQATEPHRRLGAASALAALGRPSRGAPLLADPDPSVRTRAACTMMLAARR
ncbi:hypothetical protein AKJ09_11501 [Labilithrix luteola]|uniref:HEAT repeat protein n=1 Tax=Labilithrix luteola TaxID=1391654 RepID=A0A0K1QGJ1_9BACT|nr:hypothetical protein AKJ09_11501 [Labilithrix luteola]